MKFQLVFVCICICIPTNACCFAVHSPCKLGLCPPQSLVDRAIFTVGAVGAGGKAVSWRGSCCSVQERNGPKTYCPLMSFVKYGQPMSHACQMPIYVVMSGVCVTFRRSQGHCSGFWMILEEGQPRLQTIYSYLMMFFWPNRVLFCRSWSCHASLDEKRWLNRWMTSCKSTMIIYDLHAAWNKVNPACKS